MNVNVEFNFRLFLVDMLNFCFWSDKNSPLFSLQYKGKQWTGYQSLCAGLAKAVEVIGKREGGRRERGRERERGSELARV